MVCRTKNKEARTKDWSGTRFASESAVLIGSTRWALALIIVLMIIAVGCAKPRKRHQLHRVQDAARTDTVVHAFDTHMETRLVDRLELDHLLRTRHMQVRVVDGVVSVTGEVATPLEKERVSELLHGIPGVIDVANELDIRPMR